MLEHRLLKYRIDASARLLVRNAGLDPAHHPQPPIAAFHPRTFAVDRLLPGDGNVDVLRCTNLHRAFESRRRDAGNGERDIVEIDLLADDVAIRGKARRPIA